MLPTFGLFGHFLHEPKLTPFYSFPVEKIVCVFFFCVCVCRAATPATASKPTTTQKAVRKTQEGT